MPRLAHDRRTGHFLPRRRRSNRRRRRNALVAGGSYYSFNRPRRRRRRNKRGVPLTGARYRPRIRMSGITPLQEARLGMYTTTHLSRRRRKRRRKAANPGFRRRRRSNARRRGRRSNPGRSLLRRRRRRNWGIGHASNRRRRRGRRFNPFHRRRRSYNPGGFRVSGFVGNLKSLARVDTWVGVGQAGIGFSAAIVLPKKLGQWTGKSQFTRGWYGVGASAASAALAGALAGVVSERAARNVFIGGLIATAIRVVGALAPSVARDYLAVPVNGSGVAMVAAAPAAAAAAPAGGVKGLGRLVTPEQLMAGESRSRGLLGVGDWVELRGMDDDDAALAACGVDQGTLSGLSGYSQRVPSGAIRGMNDWMEFNPSAVAQTGGQGQIPSFTPSSKEVF